MRLRNTVILYCHQRFSYPIRWISNEKEGTFSGILGNTSAPVDLVSSTSCRFFPESRITRWLCASHIQPQLIVTFCENTKTLLNAHIPLVKSLEMTMKTITHPEFKHIIRSAIHNIHHGKTLSESLQGHPQYFNALMLQIIAVSESSGNLQKGLESIAKNEQKHLDTIKKIHNKLIYPLILVIASCAIFLFFILNVIPSFEIIFADLSQKTPSNIQLFLSWNYFITTYQWHIIIVAWALVVVWAVKPHTYYRPKQTTTEYLLKTANTALYHLKKQQTFCISMALLWETQIDINAALQTMIELEPNLSQQAILIEMQRHIQNGYTFAQACKNSGIFTETALTQIEIAEKTACMPSTLTYIAQTTSDVIYTKIAHFIKWIEPFSLSITGAMIGYMLINLYQPILSITNI